VLLALLLAVVAAECDARSGSVVGADLGLRDVFGALAFRGALDWASRMSCGREGQIRGLLQGKRQGKQVNDTLFMLYYW
jgi:hypothetical protein